MKTVIQKAIIIIAVTLSIAIVDQPVTATDVGGIIATDTTWDLARSPYTVIGLLQIAEGVILTIEPSVQIIGYRWSTKIEVWGTINAIGTASSKIAFKDVVLDQREDSFSEVNIQHSVIESGAIYVNAGSFNLLDSKMEGGFSELWLRPTSSLIERNIFLGFNGIDVYDGSVEIRNNIFKDQRTVNYAIRSRGGFQTVEFNSFLSTDRIALELVDNGQIMASNNYWHTTDTNIIDSMIYDANDDLNIANVIVYDPFLTEPHPNTPTLAPAANAGLDQIVFDEITLDGSLSDDPDGEITSYQWQLTHRTNSAYNRSADGQTPTVSDLKHGFYDVTLTVEDSEGSSDTDQMSFSATGLKGDFNFDGDVDGSDLFEFAENFGTHQND